jgi:hypothetical protein
MKTKTYVLLLFLTPLSIFAQPEKYNLQKLLNMQKLNVHRRTVSSLPHTPEAISLNESPGDGIALIKGSNFKNGIIEVDLKGKDVFQKSFIGIAFHALNDSTYDAVYFRPFNFRATDSVRRIHAVQYVSHPQHTWKKLRDTQNAVFEKAVSPVPDPNEWVHAKIVVNNNDVTVFVNHSAAPSLTVRKLNKRSSGLIGLWVGDGSGGAFKNLVVTKR